MCNHNLITRETQSRNYHLKKHVFFCFFHSILIFPLRAHILHVKHLFCEHSEQNVIRTKCSSKDRFCRNSHTTIFCSFCRKKSKEIQIGFVFISVPFPLYRLANKSCSVWIEALQNFYKGIIFISTINFYSKMYVREIPKNCLISN